MTKPEPERFLVLDSLRGIAACIIALVHFHMGVNNHVSTVEFFSNARLFVDFFFVLSGFVIFANYETRLKEGFGFWRFMLLRFGRLYPLHLFVLIGFIGFEVLQIIVPSLGGMAVHKPFSQEGESIQYVLATLTLTQSLGFFDTSIVGFNGPSWSISAEFYAYAFFALLLIGFKKHSKLVLSLVFIVFGILIYSPGVFSNAYGFIRCIYGFSAGALLWYFFDKYKEKISSEKIVPAFWLIMEIGAVVAVILFLSLYSGHLKHLYAPILFMAAILIFTFEKSYISMILKHKAFVLLGVLSYSIYMTHAFIAGKAASLARYIGNNSSLDIISINENGESLLGTTIWQGDLITLGYLAIVIAVSYGTYNIIEQPGRQYFRKLAKKKADDSNRKISNRRISGHV
jgi:peptidoglycan/LPS O-acetylase OafA/YrhL